jgi:dihydrofolate reductase
MRPSDHKVDVVIVVAVARNGVIGRDGDMPWRLSTDLKRFKSVTLGKPIIMGRKTFRSIGKALPGRTNIVVTRDETFSAPGVVVAGSVEAALKIARQKAAEDRVDAVCVVGGGEIYRQALPLADLVHLTRVDSEPDGDTRFPAIDPSAWQIEHDEEVPSGPKDSVATRYVIYRRKSA